MATYSFADTMASISGPNGSFSFGAGTGNSEGGITITMVEDKNTMTIGADGHGMHSLHAGKAATIVIRLLKTAPVNKQLSDMYWLDTASGTAHGRNTIKIRDLVRGDDISADECAFTRHSDITYAKEGGEQTWTFACIKVTQKLGDGINASI